MRAVDPSGKDTRQWTFTTHMQYGQALVADGQEIRSLPQFDLAVALAPDDAEARLWQETTQRYRAGTEALEAGMWDTAIRSFTLAHGQMPDYSDVLAQLVESYRRKGQEAIEQGNWSLAIEALVQAYSQAPDDAPWAGEVTDLLVVAYRGKGQADMAKGDWSAAIESLTEAHERLPTDGPRAAEVADLLSQAYQGKGRVQMANENWGAAIETLSEALERLPDDIPSAAAVVDLLASAHRGQGIAHQEALKLKQAKASLEAALALRPRDAEARQHLDRVNYLLSKRIEIDISQQRLYAWKGDKLVYKFPVSTGLRGRDTSTGHFQVLDKIPMAYSRIWRLKMPYWLGIYWVKGIENGIHALPIRPDGSVMWAGLLGQRASYGCVILSKSAAKKLYNWADIGTQVDIHR
jgi:tetratricopeptide (TPR) repeat protein